MGRWSIIDFATDEGLIHVLDEQAAARGDEAWETASALRKKYDSKPAEMIFDFATTLQTALAQALSARAENERR